MQSVLVLGASGGVGSFVVLLAKHCLRIPLVLASCSGRNTEYVRQLGADIVIDYTTQNVEAAVLQVLQKQAAVSGPAVSAAAAAAPTTQGTSSSSSRSSGA